MPRNKYGITQEQWAIAKSNGVAERTVHQRMQKGATVEQAIAPNPAPIITDEQKEIAKRNGIPLRTVYCRIQRGMPPEKAIEPVGIKLTYDQKFIASRNGINYQLFRKRIRKGWNLFDAIITKPGTKPDSNKYKTKQKRK